MLFALGLGDRVAAVTHECDYPPGAEQLPHLTRSVIPEGLPAAEIDARRARAHRPRRVAVRARRGRARGARRGPDRDPGGLRGLRRVVRRRARGGRAPAHAAAGDLARPVHARRGAGRRAAAGRGRRRATRRASELAEEAAERIEAVERAVRGRAAPARGRARVARPDLHRRPLGAADDRARRRARTCSGCPGEKSRTAEWAEVEAAAPEVVVSMPCGYYAEQAAAETIAAARAARRRSARAWWRWTPPPTSRARARAWWTAWSCSATCCTPSSCRRRRSRRSIELDLERAAPGASALDDHDRARPPRATPSATHTQRRHDVGHAHALGQLDQHERGQRAADQARRCGRRSRCSGP